MIHFLERLKSVVVQNELDQAHRFDAQHYSYRRIEDMAQYSIKQP
jgi:hypothetical protein